MRVSAKVDYAVRALCELAAAGTEEGTPLKGDRIAEAQGIPLKFCENILAELRRAGIVGSRRGTEGGYWLAQPAGDITIADVIRVVEGPLADVRGEPPEELEYPGAAAGLLEVWIATRAALRRVTDVVTLDDIVAGALPAEVSPLLDDPDAWTRRPEPHESG